MGSTVRLSPELQARAARFAAELGISMNALLAVALRDYLDARERRAAKVAAVEPEKRDSTPKGTEALETAKTGPEASPEPADGAKLLTRKQRRAMERAIRSGKFKGR